LISPFHFPFLLKDCCLRLTLDLPSQLKQLSIFLALFICVLVAQTTEATPTRTDHNTGNTEVQGSLVIIGGALRPDNAEVWQRIVQQAGGADAAIMSSTMFTTPNRCSPP
jgi:hypothetical protein